MLYELHIGAFTPEGSFASAARKLDHLVDLGATAVEIMPLGDFRGRWGWGLEMDRGWADSQRPAMPTSPVMTGFPWLCQSNGRSSALGAASADPSGD